MKDKGHIYNPTVYDQDRGVTLMASVNKDSSMKVNEKVTGEKLQVGSVGRCEMMPLSAGIRIT